MCAFGIIIGDTIPHVIRSVFPNISNVPILFLLGNRQFVIALCTICVSYPLSLYRDIHKLSFASGLALIGMLIIVISVYSVETLRLLCFFKIIAMTFSPIACPAQK